MVNASLSARPRITESEKSGNQSQSNALGNKLDAVIPGRPLRVLQVNVETPGFRALCEPADQPFHPDPKTPALRCSADIPTRPGSTPSPLTERACSPLPTTTHSNFGMQPQANRWGFGWRRLAPANTPPCPRVARACRTQARTLGVIWAGWLPDEGGGWKPTPRRCSGGCLAPPHEAAQPAVRAVILSPASLGGQNTNAIMSDAMSA
jgi:hypothetical protein